MHASQVEHDHYDLFARHIYSLTKHGSEVRGCCPFHDDHTPSWTGNCHTGLWRCFGCGAQGNAYQFAERVGESLEMGNGQQARKIVATYDYTDERGALLFQAVRFDPKDFRQRRPTGNGEWAWNLDGVRRVLYRLPEILKAEIVYHVEGEKDADRLHLLGIPATTNPGGAGKWREEYSQVLTGKRVVILPDNDPRGEQHALDVARSLLPVAAAAKIVRLPGLPSKGDVSDWLDAGHTKEELAAIVRAAPILRTKDLRTEQKPQSSGLALIKLRDLLNEPEESVAWLVDKMLPAGGFSLLVAKPKVGKSTLARNLALAIAQGRDFFSKPTQQGPVIYLALEEKRSEVKKHFRDMGATGEEDIYIHAATAPADALKQIRAVAEEKKPALIIIDPLFRLTRVKDGNDYVQVTQALEPLLALARETGAHVLCVHHAGKAEREGGDSILGSTALFAAVDTALFMKRSERCRTISSQQRYGEDLAETVLRFDPLTRTVTLGETKEREEVSKMKNAIAEFLKAQDEPLSEPDIKEGVEGNNRHKQTALREMVEEKQVVRTGAGKKGDRYQFSLAHLSLYLKYESENLKEQVRQQKDASYSHFSNSDLFTEPAEAQQSESENQETTLDPWEDEL